VEESMGEARLVVVGACRSREDLRAEIVRVLDEEEEGIAFCLSAVFPAVFILSSLLGSDVSVSLNTRACNRLHPILESHHLGHSHSHAFLSPVDASISFTTVRNVKLYRSPRSRRSWPHSPIGSSRRGRMACV
jgi:hypothetical protein